MNDPYRLEVSEVLAQLGVEARRGLSPEEAEERLRKHGPNELRAAQRISPWKTLLDQFKNALILVLLAATALSAFLGEGLEAIVIAVIVLFAVGLGFIQEYRAERAIEALREMAAPTATVIRGGEQREVAARELVPGDVILLGAGDRIPADARLIESFNLKIEESALTGESLPVEKHTRALEGDLGVGDRSNMAWAGTAVAYGRGRGVVTATGMETEFGKIAQLLQSVETTDTPLQQNLDKVGRVLARAGLVVVAGVVGLGLLRGQPFFELLVFGIALAVAVVPEALPAVVTISLALGVRRMVKRHALIRRLPAVETLGSVSVICSDKTGTLTRDEMTLRRILMAGEAFEVTGAGYEPRGAFLRDGQEVEPTQPLRELLQAAVLASDARLQDPHPLAPSPDPSLPPTPGEGEQLVWLATEPDQSRQTLPPRPVREGGRGRERGPGGEGPGGGPAVWTIQGDPTEGALLVAAAKAGLDKPALDERFPRVGEIPFTSESKRMTTLHQTPEGVVAYSKGAPEILLDFCVRRRTAAGEEPLDEAGRREILEAARAMASEALRVLAVATRRDATQENAERDLTFLGLVGMIDPPRQEVKEAIRVTEHAGIKPVMITGDHPVTAEAIARELHILTDGRVVTGGELEGMDDGDLERDVEDIEVYARVSPAHKLRVVTAFQKRGYSVAMTGDGVNDAPALKKADIGIAMGITGTDVTKEAAAMTLTDDNFASIVAAVEEGRAVFDNIKKYLMFLLSSNIGEILLFLGASLAGLPLPLSAVQILYVNLATDGLPALALAVDPPEKDLMDRPPRDPRHGIFTRPVVSLMTVGGVWSALVNLGLFVWALRSGRPVEEAMTLVFVSLVVIQFFKAYNYRSDRHTVLRRPFANRWLNLAILWEMALLVLIVHLPFFERAFGTFALPLADWLLAAGLAFTVTPVLELAKWMERRGWFGAVD